MKGAGSFFVIVSALAGGMGAGWWLREGDAMTPGAAGPAGQRLPASQPAAGAARPSASPDNAPATLLAWDPARTAEENELEIHAALERVPAARIAEWLRRDYRLPVTFSPGRTSRAWEVTRDALLDRLLEKDPAAFAAWVADMPPGRVPPTWIRNAAEVLRRAGTPEAAATAAKLKARNPEAWRAEELRRLSESDPEAALAMAAGGRPLLPEACAALLAADPARALAFLRDHPFHLSAVVTAFQRRGPEALESFAEKCPGDSDTARAVWQLVAADKARRGDGKAFAAFLLEHPGIQETFAHLLVEADPAAAGDAARALKGAPELQERVLAGVAVRNPALAARLFAASPDAAAMVYTSRTRASWGEPFLTSLTRSWLARDPDALRAWTLSLPGALQAKVIPQASAGLTGAEFLDFTRGVSLGDEPFFELELGARAAQNAPDTARLLSWLSGFPEADREKLTARVTGEFARTDFPAATELTVSHPDLQLRERMILEVGGAARFPDPAAAVAWGNSLPADLRVVGMTRALQNVAMKGGGWDPALIQATVEVIAAEPPESAAVWSDLAAAAVSRIGQENFGDGAAFLAAVPETARAGGLQALARGLAATMTGDPENPFPAVETLERVQDSGMRRRIAENLLPGVGDLLRWLPAEQSAALKARLETLTR